MKLILTLLDPLTLAEAGGKVVSLARAGRAGFPVPPWIALSSEACLHGIGADRFDLLSRQQNPDEVQEIMKTVVPDELLIGEIRAALKQYCPDFNLFAVRSSGAEEDGAEHSFAGQLDSFLDVSKDQLKEKIAAVWQSGFSRRILDYRKQRGLPFLPKPPAVLIQGMLAPEVAGVAFSADPVSGRRSVAVVSAVAGLGNALVSGEVDADTWRVDRSGSILEKRVSVKQKVQNSEPVLEDHRVREVAGLVRRCAALFSGPQDIEWAFERGSLFLLQSRPITSLYGLPDPDGVRNLWDNSNIAESYGGITTPLTYSFARRAYEEVYRQFCRMMAVPLQRIEANADVFRCMIGLIRGRVYYNLLNWYRVLAMLPGFTLNRRFMEQMMGVKESLPEDLIAEIQSASTSDRFRDGVNLAQSIAGLIWNLAKIKSLIQTFYDRLNQALSSSGNPLDQQRPDELVLHYRALERKLLTRWDAPLINDFFAMIFYGLLNRCVVKWCGDQDGSLQNNLLCGEGGMISAEPARRVRELARIASKEPNLIQILAESPIDLIPAQLKQFPEFEKAYSGYLEKFGDRCLDELKLESPTLHDDPTTLIRSIACLAGRLDPKEVDDFGKIDLRLRKEAEAKVEAALRGQWGRSLLFSWILKQARSRVRDRENLRFERTRLFGRIRRIFIAMGNALCAEGVLEKSNDVFYLTVDEVLGFCEGTSTTIHLGELVKLRRTEFESYRRMEAPSDRFETFGMVGHGNSYRSTKTAPNPDTGRTGWSGIGCCPGVVRGTVCVVTDPRSAVIKPGEILVAERTDPGWIMLFASAAGLLVERGSLLSHSAIVSREMGIPSIVSIPGITRELKSGQLVEMNGATGKVYLISND